MIGPGVVSIAGQQDEITTLQVMVFVPQLCNMLFHANQNGINQILVAVGAEENGYTKFLYLQVK